MKDYKRLTKNDWHNTKFDVAVNKEHRAVLHRLWELENRIESGELDYVEAKDKKIAQLITERDKWKRRAEVAEQKATVWKDCANKWQKYYKEQAERELEEERK